VYRCPGWPQRFKVTGRPNLAGYSAAAKPLAHRTSIAAAINTMLLFSMIVTDDIGKLNAVPRHAH